MAKLANGQFQKGSQSLEAVSTRKKELPATMQPFKWQPEQSGNPDGRSKGSRNQLAERFIADLYQDWQEHGLEALAAARETKPADYLKVIVMVLPRDIKVTLETMTDEELSTRIDRLTTSLGIRLVPRAPKTIELDSHVLPNPDGENEDDNRTE